MSHPNNEAIKEEYAQEREEFLHRFHRVENDVETDDQGREFVRIYQPEDGEDHRKEYLPVLEWREPFDTKESGDEPH